MRHRMLVAALTLVLPFAASLSAQQVTGVWQPTDPGNWNEGSNWDTFGFPDVPNGDFGDIAEISNGGTAIVDEEVPTVANLNITSGVVQIDDGGSLSAVDQPDPDLGGDLTIGGAGRLSVADGGLFSADANGTNSGELAWNATGGDVSFGGNFTSSGVLAPTIGGGAATPIQVGGVASLSGTVRPSFDGVVPAFGDSWDLVAAGSASGSLAIDPSSAPALAPGLFYSARVTESGASLEVSNQLVVTVNRATGAVSVANPVGASIDVKGYSLLSANGFLNADGWSSLSGAGAAGWLEANPGATHLSELNLEGMDAVAVGDTVPLGNAYMPGPQGPSEEDVAFEYLTGSGDVVSALVQYEGPVNDIVLRVDPDTGEGTLLHASAFLGDREVKGYSILSESGALNPAGWTSLESSGAGGAGWLVANPKSTSLNELNLEGSTVLSNGTQLPLGSLFSIGGAEDLVLEYLLADGSVLTGTVEYGGPPPCINGDVDCNGVVDLVDFNILKANFGKSPATRGEGDLDENGTIDLVDFNELKASFGNSASVPEPAAWMLIASAALCCGVIRRRSRIA